MDKTFKYRRTTKRYPADGLYEHNEAFPQNKEQEIDTDNTAATLGVGFSVIATSTVVAALVVYGAGLLVQKYPSIATTLASIPPFHIEAPGADATVLKIIHSGFGAIMIPITTVMLASMPIGIIYMLSKMIGEEIMNASHNK